MCIVCMLCVLGVMYVVCAVCCVCMSCVCVWCVWCMQMSIHTRSSTAALQNHPRSFDAPSLFPAQALSSGSDM